MLSRLLITCLLLLTVPLSHANRGAAITDHQAIRVASGVWVIHGPMEFPNPANQGFMNNPAWVKTEAGIVIIDPGSSVQVGEMLMSVIRKQTQDPIVAVFNTHKHGDHWLGNQAIRALYPDVPIYAHPNVLIDLKNGLGETWISAMSALTKGATSGTKTIGADHPLNDGDEITVGGVMFRVHNKGDAHTNGDLMIEIPATGVLFAGDNAVNGRVVRLDDSSVKGNIEAMTYALSLNLKVVVPGHGPTGGPEILREYSGYLSAIYDTVAELYEEGLSDFEMKQPVIKACLRYQGWAGFDDEIGRNLNRAYLEIEANDF